jgi:hypothetical protein
VIGGPQLLVHNYISQPLVLVKRRGNVNDRIRFMITFCS